MVSRNVARLVRPPRVPKHEISPLGPNQAHQLIDAAAENRLRALWITALGTGCRQGELLGPRWDDVDLDPRRLRVRDTLARVEGKLTLLEPKTDRSRRTIRLPRVVVSELRAHRTRQKMERLVAGSRWVDSGHVFATTIGTPVEAAAVTRAFKRALMRAGLPHSRFHDFRHAVATFLLGHSSIVLTSNTYGHVLEQRQREVAHGLDAVLGA
ncbi:MAG: site-specific integrase [Chloroflexota bacterium]